MLTRETLINVAIFMERAPHGEAGTARSWAQTYEAVWREIEAMDEQARKDALAPPVTE